MTAEDDGPRGHMSSGIFRSSVPQQFVAESCTLKMHLARKSARRAVDQDKL